MAENYSEAAIRHFYDSELLAKGSRWCNAGHLVGFAAECAVKCRLQGLRPSTDVPRGHFPDLINIAKKHLSGRRDTTLHAVLKIKMLMQGWDVSDRYAADASIGKGQYDMWRQHASRLMSAAGLKR
jgi:hypothetical protein